MKKVFSKLAERGIEVLGKELSTDAGKINLWTTLLATILCIIVLLAEPVELVLNWILKALEREQITLISPLLQSFIVVATIFSFFWCLYVVSKLESDK